jgi:hypothetical protein
MTIFATALLTVSLTSLQHMPARFMMASEQANAQELNSSERSREILASFNKTKYKTREKFGVHREKYKQVHSDPVARPVLADYAGNYKDPDFGYTLEITPSAAGVVVTGSEAPGDSQPPRRFRLENAHLDGALLTGTKAYEDGAREPFEGLFINMTDTEGTSPTQITHRVTTFGLGVIGVHVKAGDDTFAKIFYQFEQ